MAKKRRRSRDSFTKYGRNNRRLDQPYAPIRDRLVYLCDFMFAGDHYAMAGAVGICYRHFYSFLHSSRQLTIRIAAQIVVRLGVRGDWLLTGAGPIFATRGEDENPGFLFPREMRSAFPVCEPVETATGCPPPQPPIMPLPQISNEIAPKYFAAAAAIFRANTRNLPVALFLGATSPTYRDPPASALFQERYLHFLAMTLSAAQQDIRAATETGETDLNHLARLAAASGMGYGEAIGHWAFNSQQSDRRDQSVLASAYDAGVPVTIMAEIGEIADHLQPTYGGAELGAAIGAAAYVDQLVFARYFEAFSLKPGGVIICVGEPDRWLTVVRRIADMPPADFTLVLLHAPDHAFFPPAIPGADIINIPSNSAIFFSQLLRACQLVYANGGGSEGSSGQ